MEKPLKILMLAAEAAPLAKAGGLADVTTGLGKSLRGLGHDVRLMIPRYGFISEEEFGLALQGDAFLMPLGEKWEEVIPVEGMLDSVLPVYLPGSWRYFRQYKVYGYQADDEGYVFFDKAALELTRRMNWRPDAIHCHDWHTGLVPNWLRTLYRDDPLFGQTASVFTIHNLAYQGIFGAQLLSMAGLTHYGLLDCPGSPELGSGVNLMARGIVGADMVNTVSRRYAEEVLTQEYGEGLEGLLQRRGEDFVGIRNGLDYEHFDPATDPNLAFNYDVTSLARRAENKRVLQEEAGLPIDSDRPLIGVVSRLVEHKGLDIFLAAAEQILAQDVQVVVLGQGEPRYHRRLSELAAAFPDRISIRLTFDVRRAQRIYAGADIFLMPSRVEPCGVAQLIALRYGCVPVVRATGGLAETITDFDQRPDRGVGFVFEEYSSVELLSALDRALARYANQAVWRTLMLRGMKADFSWQAVAPAYVELYQRAVAARASDRWQVVPGWEAAAPVQDAAARISTIAPQSAQRHWVGSLDSVARQKRTTFLRGSAVKTQAIIMAGGRGTRLSILSQKRTKSAVPFAGKYRIIDFVLSNCVNSGIFDVGILTQYRPHSLNDHIRAGRPWDLDRELSGGLKLLQVYQREGGALDWYRGTADAVYQNLSFVRRQRTDSVLILSGDHIYKMDYSSLLHYHHEKQADVTVCVIDVLLEEASRFGILVTDTEGRVVEFQEKPLKPRGTLASMGIYVFRTDILAQRLGEDARLPNSAHDFGQDVLPRMLALGDRLYVYPFEGYWVDVGTVQAYWEANMDLLLADPPLNLQDRNWVVHTRSEERPPVNIRTGAAVSHSLITDGCVIEGRVEYSVLSPGVRVRAGAVVRDSIVFTDCDIEAGAFVDRAILDKNVVVGEGAHIGFGTDYTPNRLNPQGLNTGLTLVGKNTHLPAGLRVGRNCVIYSDLTQDDFLADFIASGQNVGFQPS